MFLSFFLSFRPDTHLHTLPVCPVDTGMRNALWWPQVKHTACLVDRAGPRTVPTGRHSWHLYTHMEANKTDYILSFFKKKGTVHNLNVCADSWQITELMDHNITTMDPSSQTLEVCELLFEICAFHRGHIHNNMKCTQL